MHRFYEINRWTEFLMGINYGLYLDKPTYESLLCLLKDLVHAQNRDSRSRGFTRAPKNMGLRSRRSRMQNQPSGHCARSTSPHSSESNYEGNYAEASPRSGLKRSAQQPFRQHLRHSRIHHRKRGCTRACRTIKSAIHFFPMIVMSDN
jgi:hypothetical protein